MAVEALARTGLGELTLIDMDDVCVTNINRQIHAMSGTAGKSKIEVDGWALSWLTLSVKWTWLMTLLVLTIRLEYLSKEFDFVLDAIEVAWKLGFVVGVFML